MSTYRELTYMVLDELHFQADDANITEDHIIFLLDKYRALALKSAYTDVKKSIPESNYQTVCLNLEVVDGVDDDPCSSKYLRSEESIPNLIGVGVPRIGTRDAFGGEITYVSRDRFKFVGNNKWLRNFIYCTIGPDNKLYMRSSNPQAYYLEMATFSGVFENSAEAAKLSCDGEEDAGCDIMDKNFPIEEALIPNIIKAIIQELSSTAYLPADTENNAADNLVNKQSVNYRNYGRRRTADSE